MSVPVSACLVNKAAKGDEQAYERLKSIMFINLECGHWTYCGCVHEPPCEPASEEQFETVDTRLKKEWDERKEKPV
jgi:hypothetical protein